MILEVFRALSSITDAAEWFLKRRLATAKSVLDSYSKDEWDRLRFLNQSERKKRLSDKLMWDPRYQVDPNYTKYVDDFVYSDRGMPNRRGFGSQYDEKGIIQGIQNKAEAKELRFKRYKNYKGIGKVQRVRNILQPGPLKKFRSIVDNVTDLDKILTKTFGKYSSDVFQLITGFTFEEFLGFANTLRYFKATLAYLDPKKITGDLLRSLGQGVNQMFAELGEITGSDTLELSKNTEVTNLSSSWLSHGWFMRLNSGANMVSNGTLMVWDNNGKTYTITNCPESVWDKMKQAQGRNGHWYAPVGAGSWLHYYMKIGVVSIW